MIIIATHKIVIYEAMIPCSGKDVNAQSRSGGHRSKSCCAFTRRYVSYALGKMFRQTCHQDLKKWEPTIAPECFSACLNKRQKIRRQRLPPDLFDTDCFGFSQWASIVHACAGLCGSGFSHISGPGASSFLFLRVFCYGILCSGFNLLCVLRNESERFGRLFSQSSFMSRR